MKNKKLVDEVGRLPDVIAEYYVEQMNLYKWRKEMLAKHLADKKEGGFPITKLDRLKVKVEGDHIKYFKNKLKEIK